MSQLVELKRLHQPPSVSFEHDRPAIALALVKNEGDIIPAWLSHVCELFDLVYIVDHQSTDGTREFLLDAADQTKKIHLFSFDQPGYFQAEITNQLAQLAAGEYPDSWLFPLDADEFLAFPNKSEFSSLLGRFAPGQVLLLNWQNCIPMYLQADQEIRFNFPCFIPSSVGLYDKVAVNSSALLEMKWKFAQGNHRLETESGSITGLSTQVRFANMIHIPIRGMEHFALKCIQGNIAYRQLPKHRELGTQGLHWQEMINFVLKYNVLHPNVIRGFVVSYGQPNNGLGVKGASMYDLVDTGWNAATFNAAHGDVLYNLMQRSKTFTQLAAELVEKKNEYADLQRFLKIIKESHKKYMDVSLWQKENRAEEDKYNKLPDIEAGNIFSERSEIEFLKDFMSKGFTYRETPVPSTWEGHVPFLYCLLNFSKPRRFVELGTHHGNCYFAACQVSKQLNYSIECIAVDTWAGDVHTGKYEDNIYKSFTHILKRDYQHGKFIRDTFDKASEQFERGSIDILHIDGLHTYEAVAEDFATWLPMLSDRGIVMFHDTQERERGFGVWKLWAEVNGEYPSFEFKHSHGLGVLLVGKHAESNIIKLFEIAARPEYMEFMLFFFSNMGNISPLIKKK